MLSLELMGAFALAVLWINTFLVVGAALLEVGTLRRWLGQLRDLRRATVVSGDVARFSVEQTGHKAADDRARQAILFHDRGSASEVLGGRVEIGGEIVTLAASETAEVWVRAGALKEAATCPEGSFDAAFAKAKKAKGYRRTVSVAIGEGDEAFLAGSPEAPMVISQFDPRSQLRGKIALLLGFCLAMIALSGASTALALWPPVFGTVSTLGGLFGLVHFLAILQPAGVAARDLAQIPSRTALGGSWTKRGSDGAGSPAPGAELYAE